MQKRIIYCYLKMLKYINEIRTNVIFLGRTMILVTGSNEHRNMFLRVIFRAQSLFSVCRATLQSSTFTYTREIGKFPRLLCIVVVTLFTLLSCLRVISKVLTNLTDVEYCQIERQKEEILESSLILSSVLELLKQFHEVMYIQQSLETVDCGNWNVSKKYQ